jgi:hypothetical protein
LVYHGPGLRRDVDDLGVVVTDLVLVLRVDVHDLVVESLDAVAEQDVVEHLGDAVEVVGVLLVDRLRGDQVGRVWVPVPSAVPLLRTDSDGLNW